MISYNKVFQVFSILAFASLTFFPTRLRYVLMFGLHHVATRPKDTALHSLADTVTSRECANTTVGYSFYLIFYFLHVFMLLKYEIHT